MRFTAVGVGLVLITCANDRTVGGRLHTLDVDSTVRVTDNIRCVLCKLCSENYRDEEMFERDDGAKQSLLHSVRVVTCDGSRLTR